MIPFQCVEHHIAETANQPRLQTDLRRMVFQRLPVVLHQVDGILVSQRHEVEVLLPAQLIPLVEKPIALLTIPVEIFTDNVAVPLTEALNNLVV